MIRIFILFLIFIIFELQAIAFFTPSDEILQSTVVINENSKIFRKNMISFEKFLLAQKDFAPYARFVAPTFTFDKQKDLKLIAIALYFNILKNEALQNIQKEEITFQKKLLDEKREFGDYEKIKTANVAYNQAQIEYLTYKNAAAVCKRQLANFSGRDYEFCEKLDDFDLAKTLEITQNGDFLSEQYDMSEHLKYQYEKYKNLDKRLQNQPKDTEENLFELKKSLIYTKLCCIIYYFSLETSLS